MAKSLVTLKNLISGKYSTEYSYISQAGKDQLVDLLGHIGYNELLAYFDIDKIHTPNTKTKYLEWKSAKGVYNKLEIRYGSEASKREKERRRKESSSHYTCLQKQFWLNKGYTQSQALAKISELQSKNAAAGHKKTPSKNRNAYTQEFWLNKGYTQSQALAKIEDYRIRSISTSLQSFIHRHGIDLGPKLFDESNKKRLNTFLQKYGTTIPSSGAVSKASLKFFIPLYKMIRKLGIAREDIYWGIEGSKEFATHKDGRNYFYDFTIQSKKLIIEFNGLYWHPRDISEWQGLEDFYIKKLYDETKIDTIKLRGYNVIVVWEDDNFEQKYSEILEIINA